MNEHDKKEGFSYSSSVRNKTAFTILGVELFVMIVFVVLIFGVLNYFLIFPLSVMNPKLFGWLPTRSIGLNIPKNNLLKGFDPNFIPIHTPTIAPVNPTLEVISDIPGVSLTIDKKQQFIQLLQEWQLYGKNYNDPNYGSTKGTVLADVIVHLTDKIQPVFQSTDKSGVYVGSGFKITPGKLDIYVYIPNSKIKSNISEAELTFNKQALFSLYALAKQVDTKDKYITALNDVNVVFNLQKKDKSYFIHIK